MHHSGDDSTMIRRKYAVFLLAVILSYACALNVASAQGGETKPSPATSSASKAKRADKPAASKMESDASNKSAKDRDAADNGGTDKDKDAKNKKDGESSDPMSSGTFGGLKFRSV